MLFGPGCNSAKGEGDQEKGTRLPRSRSQDQGEVPSWKDLARQTRDHAGVIWETKEGGLMLGYIGEKKLKDLLDDFVGPKKRPVQMRGSKDQGARGRDHREMKKFKKLKGRKKKRRVSKKKKGEGSRK